MAATYHTTTASELVPLWLPLSVGSVLRLSWELEGLGPPESENGLNSHFSFFWVNAVISGAGFLCIHRRMRSGQAGTKQAFKREKEVKDRSKKFEFFLLANEYSWGVGSSLKDAFLSIQPGNT